MWIVTVSCPGKSPRASAASASPNLLDLLHLEKVVAAAEGAELRPAPLQRPVGDEFRVGAGDGSALLDMPQVLLAAETLLHRPAGSLFQHLALFRCG